MADRDAAVTPGPWTRAIDLRRVDRSSSAGVTRIQADVAGRPLWLESADADLVPAGDVFVPLLLPLIAGWRLRFRCEVPVDPVLQGHVERLVPIWRDWWGIGPRELRWTASRDAADPVEAAGLCFSGGVDSFHALLRREPVQALVAVHGLDVPLRSTARWAALEAHLRAVANAVGVPLYVVRTNLRDHPLTRGVPYERTFGGALAAVGHALTRHIGRLAIAPSYPASVTVPYGQHLLTDPLWSSSRLQVDPLPDHRLRADRLRDLLDEPLVHAHLSVCWAESVAPGNCGRCEKCVRTLVTLAQVGRREEFVTLPAVDLPALVEALPRVSLEQARVLAMELGRGLDRDLARAVRRLIARSDRRWRRVPSVLRRHARRWRRADG